MTDVTAGSRRRSAPRARTPAARGSQTTGERPVMILVFLICLVVPITFFVGPMRMSPYRLMLIVTIVPMFFQLVSGKFGKLILPDVLVIVYAVWLALAMLVNHGAQEIAFAGITAIESLGAYLLGRALVRGPEAFLFFTRCLIAVLAVMLPFVALEALTGNRLIAEVVRGAGAHFGVAHQEPRWGMTRAQGPFEHPILWGVFASSGFALAYYALGGAGNRAKGMMGLIIAGAGTFFSLSMGAILSGMCQSGLMGYEHVTRGMKKRWKIFLSTTTSIYLFLYFASHRGAVGLFIAYFAFNQFAANVRLMTWSFGTDVVMANPIFGIGFNDWARPFWLTGSIDNFWLLNAMRYGLPAALCLVAAVIILIVRIGRRETSDPILLGCRLGYVITLAGLCFALASVHAWNALYSYFFFLLGAGVWLIGETGEEKTDAEVAEPQDTARRRAPALTPAEASRARRPGPRTASAPIRPATSGPSANGPVRPVRPRRN